MTEPNIIEMIAHEHEDLGHTDLRSFPYTDTGNGERLAHQFAGQIRYSHPQKIWFTYTGRRWEPDQTGDMLQRAKWIARALYQEASLIEDRTLREACAGWARKCESADRRKAALFCTQSEPGIPILAAEFDADPFLLNCLNGTVDLRSGQLRPHRREDLITKLAPVAYDASARSHAWDDFLHDSTGGDQDLLDFLQRAAGYSLTGSVREEVLFFVHGPTASGKSTFLESLKASFGDYARVADFETFIQRREVGGIRNDIAELAGRRLVVSIEVDEGKRLAEGLVKMLTGGDTVRARFLYQEAFEFPPQFKLWLAANHAPKVKDDDSAIWRRILRIPFEHVVPKDRRNAALKAVLKDSAESGPAILAWAVEGCLRWQESGLSVPKIVEEATEQYRLDMNPMGDFFDDCCVFGDALKVTANQLHKVYEHWCGENGIRQIDSKEFAERLRARNCKPTRIKICGKENRGWAGIGVPGVQEKND